MAHLNYTLIGLVKSTDAFHIQIGRGLIAGIRQFWQKNVVTIVRKKSSMEIYTVLLFSHD